LLVFSSAAVRAADNTQAEVDALKKDIEDLRKKLNSMSSGPAMKSSVDRALDSKYGPNASVSTKSGKLTISGLVQVWYYSIENDNEGLFQDTDVNGIPDTNEASDNDSFRVRRTELKFTMDIHENVTAVIMIDPAREATSFPLITDNQANSSIFKRRNNVAPEFDNANGPGLGSTAVVAGVQQGSGAVPRLLQDAYINYHGVIPHHDFTIGQFKPFFGEEGIRSSAQLDFVERSFLGQLGDARDLGITAHGTWWDDRFQYWLGAFNGAGNFYGSAGQAQNRSDDNDEKDFYWRVLVRPLWKDELWGSIEIGGGSGYGIHGEASGNDPVAAPINGLNRNENWAIRHGAWLSYMPGGPVRGWWIRSEWQYIKDRNAPGQVLALQGGGGSDSGFEQTGGRPFRSEGWYISTGYKISDSRWCDEAPSWLKPFEFAFRYDTFENVQVADLVNENKNTDNFTTVVYTGGINYYIKGHNAKTQLNYNIVDGPDSGSNAGNRKFHNVDNNSLVVSFQVAF
jgi:hypothetical protein